MCDMSPPTRWIAREQILGVEDADDVLRLVSPQRQAGVGAGERRLDDLLRGIVGVDCPHGGAVDHHVGDFQFAEPEQIVDILGLAFLHFAVLGGNLDEAFDLDVGENFLMRGFADAEKGQDRA